MMTEQQLPASHHRALPGGESPLGRWYHVAGRRIWCYRAGAGSPAVVFLPGASAVGLDYLNLADQVSEFATAVLYDRGGTGWSDDAELPRPAADVATELHELLEVAGVPGPYLLVAHSLGGAYARRFAQLFPADVAGVVYLDAFSEDNDEYVPERLHLANLSQPDPGPLMLRLMRPIAGRMYRGMLAGWPEPLRRELIERHLSEPWWRAGVRERGSMAALADELKQGGRLPDVPVIVLTPLGVDPGLRLMMSARSIRESTDAKVRLNAALAASVSDGEQRILNDARHSTITTDDQEAVISAIRDVAGKLGG